MPKIVEPLMAAAVKHKKAAPRGRSSKEANLEGSQSGKAMQGVVPPSGTTMEILRQTEEVRLQGYVPL